MSYVVRFKGEAPRLPLSPLIARGNAPGPAAARERAAGAGAPRGYRRAGAGMAIWRILFFLSWYAVCGVGAYADGEPRWLRWAADPESGAPFAFHDFERKSTVCGVDVDIVHEVARRMGHEPVFYQNDIDGLIPGLKRHLYDCVVDGVEVTREHAEEVAFSIPYYATHLQLVVRNDNVEIKSFADCSHKSVGTLKSSTGYAMLGKLPRVDIKTYTDEVHAYTDLKLGRVDAVLLDAPIAMYYAGWDPSFKFIEERIGTLKYAIAVRKDDAKLLQQVNFSLKEMMTDGTLQMILARWNLWTPAMAEYTGDTRVVSVTPVHYQNFVEHIRQAPMLRERLERYVAFMPVIAKAAVKTLVLSLISMLVAIVIGFFVATARVYGPKFVRFLAAAYVEIVRGTPLMIQLLLIFYGLPLLHIQFAPFLAGIIGLGINYSAYEAENYRAGLAAVPRGQMEAALALGMTPKQALRYVVFPQAIRFVLPPVTNDFISLLKDSSLVSLITITELTKAYTQFAATYYDYLGAGLLVALVYLLIGLPFVRVARYAEHHLAVSRRKS